MHKRVLAITVLAVALVFSQVSSLLIASLCSHRIGLASCDTQITQIAAYHEHMGHEQMESMETEPTPEQNADGKALDQPAVPCKHCAVHSRMDSDPAFLAPKEAHKRSDHLALPLIVSRVVSVPSHFVKSLTTRAHGPPGKSTSRHILINIFRI